MKLLPLLAVLFPVFSASGQETVFDVPSADILEKGKVYGELDGTVRIVDPLATFTPRVVVGIGRGIEIGANFDGLSAPALGELLISPTAKLRLWQRKAARWSFFIGETCFFLSASGRTTREITSTQCLLRSGNTVRELALVGTTFLEMSWQKPIALGDSSPSSRQLQIASPSRPNGIQGRLTSAT